MVLDGANGCPPGKRAAATKPATNNAWWFCSGRSVPCFPGRNGHLYSQTESLRKAISALEPFMYTLCIQPVKERSLAPRQCAIRRCLETHEVDTISGSRSVSFTLAGRDVHGCSGFVDSHPATWSEGSGFGGEIEPDSVCIQKWPAKTHVSS